jgi:hypothetical protein
MTLWRGKHECTAGINRNCTGESETVSYGLSVEGGRVDMCERCERTYRRRYNKAMDRFYNDAMDGKIPGPLSGGGVFIIG